MVQNHPINSHRTRPDGAIRRSRRSGLRWIAVVAALGALASACGDDDTTTTGSTTEAPTTSAQGGTSAPPVTSPITGEASFVYMTRGEHLAVVGREVPEGDDAIEVAVQAVLDGPDDLVESEAGIGSEVPEGTTLRGVAVENGVATVDLSGEFESGGGSLSMQMRVAQIVFTVTEFPGVERVDIHIDGEAVESIGGEGVPARGLDRTQFQDLLPPILVQEPLPGAPLERTFTASGLANVFEGTVSIEVLDESGEIVASGFGTGAMGEWQPFEAEITVPEGTRGSVIVRFYEESMEDGRHLNVIEVPAVIVD